MSTNGLRSLCVVLLIMVFFWTLFIWGIILLF